MKYPAWLPYPRSLIRAAIVLGGIFGLTLIVGTIATILDSVFGVLTWFNFLVAPVSTALVMVVIALFLWGMALLHQLWSDRPMKWNPHWRSWFGGVADLLIATLGGIVGVSFLSDHAPAWFGLTIVVISTAYIYYLFDLFEEGRQLERSRQDRQRKEQNRQRNRKLPKINRPRSSQPHDPIEAELEEMKRKLDKT
jgi:hypothetical protein